jgi:uncharacterized OB-fold protein
VTSERLLPVPDDTSAPYWEAAGRHELTVARCGRCATLTLPPDVMCVACGSTDPQYEFVAVSGRGVVRSWTVVRQSFLPGFQVPYVLVDVELGEQAGLRIIGRFLGSTDELSLGAPVVVVFEDLADGIAVPAFQAAR